MLSGPGTDAVDMAWLGWSAMLGHVCPVEERWAPALICSTTPQSPVLVVELVDHAGQAGMSSPPVAASPLQARGTTTNSVDRLNQTYAATHNIRGLCVPRIRCPVVPLSLRLKRETKHQDLSCVLTEERRVYCREKFLFLVL